MAEELPEIPSKLDEEPSSLGDWLVRLGFQAVGYSFMIALLGLFAGMFGGMFGQTGSRWGWIGGALLAAVGYPLGWIRMDNARLTKLSQAEQEREERRPRQYLGPFKGGLAGLILGAILGLLVGMVIVVYWLSFALSPLAPASWREGWPADSFGFPGAMTRVLAILGWTAAGFALVFLTLGLFGQISQGEKQDQQIPE